MPKRSRTDQPNVWPRRRSRSPGLELLESRRLLASFTVTNTADNGPGSLRQAIVDSNSSPGFDQIGFAIPGPDVQVITPLSALPTVSDPVEIDGYSQPGAH